VGGCGYDIRKRQGVFCKTTGASWGVPVWDLLTRGPVEFEPLDPDHAVRGGRGPAVDPVHGSMLNRSEGVTP
jgi:hypothetical protein